MDVDAWLSVGTHGDIAIQGCDFDLLSDRDGLILLRLPIEERKLGAAECADRGDLRPAEALFNREILQAAHRFIALLQDNREGALAIRLVKQFALHVLPPFPQMSATSSALALALEILDGTLAIFCLGPCREGPEVATLAGLRVDLPRIETVLPGLELADHLVASRGRGALGRTPLQAQTSPHNAALAEFRQPGFDPPGARNRVKPPSVPKPDGRSRGRSATHRWRNNGSP
jgi:hypothetical protein